MTIDTSFRFRFAPSPTGALHLGSAASALINAGMASRYGGTLLVRIEDIDPTRSRPEHITAILDDLRWLGLQWPEPVLCQSQHLPRYRLALDALRRHHLVYPCFATRAEIAEAVAGRSDVARDPDGTPLYPGLCKGMTADAIAARVARGDPMCWRLDMDRALAMLKQDAPLAYRRMDRDGQTTPQRVSPGAWGDVVIARKDTPTSYHLSVVVDDAYQRITHIVRGRDLEPATSLHRLLQTLLGLPAPIYHHHALVLDPDRQKLSKRARALSLRHLRGAGVQPDDIVDRLGGVLAASGVACS